MLDDPTYQDRELVQALQAHRLGALPLVFDRYGTQLFDYCHALLRDQEAASLALHDTLLAAEAHADRLRDPRDFRGWLYALARRQCRRILSGPDRPTVRREAPESPDEFATPQERQRHLDARRMVHGAMARLTGRQREAVDLTIRHGLTDTELAGVFSIPLEEAAALAEGSREDLADAVEEKVGHRRISLNKLMSVLPIAETPAELEQRVMATASDPSLAQQRAAIASQAMPFNQVGWPSEDRERSGHRAASAKTTRAPIPPVAAPVPPPVEQAPWDVPTSNFPQPDPMPTETMLDPGMFNRPLPPPVDRPLPPPVDNVPLLVGAEGAEPPGGRHGARSAAHAAGKPKQARHGLAMWVPLAAVLCVGVIVFSLFKLVPSMGSTSAGSSPSSTENVDVAPSDEGDTSEEPAASDKKNTNGKPKPATSSTPSASVSVSVSPTTKPPSPKPSSTTATPKPSSTPKPKPGTATVSGCTIPAAATKCSVSITAVGGKVTWTASATGKLTGAGRGTLAAGESATVTISVNKGTPCVEGSGPVLFRPGGSATVSWLCPVVEEPPVEEEEDPEPVVP